MEQGHIIPAKTDKNKITNEEMLSGETQLNMDGHIYFVRFYLIIRDVLTCKLLGYSLEQFLDGGGVADESGGHFDSTRGNVTNSRFHIVWDPFHKVTVKKICKYFSQSAECKEKSYEEFLFWTFNICSSTSLKIALKFQVITCFTCAHHLKFSQA